MRTNIRRVSTGRPLRVAISALATLTLLAGGLTATPGAAAAAAGVTDGLVLWYKLDDTAGTKATDSSGKGHDGTIAGTPTWGGDQGLTFNGTDTYVRVPDNIMSGLSSISVAFDVRIDPTQKAPYWLYGFGNTGSNGNGNGYFFATGDAFRNAVSLTDYNGEQNTKPAAGGNLARGVWTHFAYTQTGSTGTLYQNGVAVGTNTAITVLPSAVGNGKTTADYFGRSLYPDNYFNGKMRDVRVYDRALSATEVDTLATPSNTAVVAADTAALSLGDTSAVTKNLTLPAAGAGGSTVTWKSSDASVISDAGAVTQPATGQPDAHATLTATVKRGSVATTKTFAITVKAAGDDLSIANAAAAGLVVHNIADVRGNLALPDTGDSGSTVTWTSANAAVVSAAGEVHRPAHGAGPATVKLTATVTYHSATATRDFTATVPELPEKQPLKGYMFSYFTGEGTANGEQIYNAVSNGNNPLSWREINSGKPVITSTVGTTGLRDPFIIRSPEGDKFYQIATDLKIFGNGNWDASQRTGSKSIMVAESTDLVNWTNQRLVKVSPDTAGNTWAPEAYYDPTLGAYVVFWASKIYAASDTAHTGDTYNKMMYATTRDFYTFSAPQVWKDPGYSVIDSTMIQNNGHYYRFTKDERNQSSSSPCSKFIIEEKSDTIRNLNYAPVSECIGSGAMNAAEGPLVFKSNTENKWYLFLDEFGGRGYIPFSSTDLDSGKWTPEPKYTLPASPRHGTVLPVTAAEYDRLLAKYQPDAYATKVSPVTVVTGIGQAPVLPATVPAVYGDGVSRSAAVTWDSVDPAQYAALGTFTVHGTLVDNASTTATATVTVVKEHVTPHLKLRYQFDETGGVVARDSSGNGFDGTYNRTPTWGPGVDGGAVTLSGGPGTSTTAPYVTIPNGVLNGVNNMTVSAWVKWSSSTTVNQWIYGLGVDNNKYLFTGPLNGGNVLYSAITTGSWQAESKMASGAALPGGSWQHIAVTVDSTSHTSTMYLNGVKVATATGVTAKPSDLYDSTKTYSGFIGKSMYSPDPYFAGSIDDFRIYDTALSPAEILQLAGKTTSIAGVTLPQLKVDALIDDTNGVVKLPVKEGTDVRALAPKFILASGATISPDSGTVHDFSKPVTYTVTGADGTTRKWTVQALVMKSPVLPGLYADPNITVFGDTFWIYPTTDGFPGWSGTQFHAFSSTDLVHWTDHGVVLDLGPDVPWADNSAWAPTIAQKNGKYYFYFSGGATSGDTRKQLGVAVGDSPAGPFHDALGKPLVPAGAFGGQMIDSDVFTDDDGKSYLYWGNGNAYQVQLNDDMVSFDTSKVKTYHPTGYNEGSFVFKRNGTYYFSWSENDTGSPDYQVAYATSKSPLGPWSDRVGVILSKDPSQGILGTGHHSVVRQPNSDDWYIAYHRFAIPGGDGTHRETTVDRLQFNADGSIKPVVPTLTSVDPVTVAHAGPTATGSEGTAIGLAGWTSNGANRPTWSYTPGPDVDPGATCTFAERYAATTTVTCTDDGTYQMTLSAGGSQDSALVKVSNVAPVATVPGGHPTSQAPVATGTEVRFTVPISDAGSNDTHTCAADWGDRMTSAGVVSGNVCTVRHKYTAVGVFRPLITVNDDDGGTVAGLLPYVATYVAGSGSVAGSGWAWSPRGSLRGSWVRSVAAGDVDFAFSAGPRAGGSTWLQFPAGRMVFRSTSQSSVAIGSGSSTFTGVGTINGAGHYRFRVTVTDNGKKDRIQVTIWDAHTGKVLYDLSGGRTVPVSGGGIVVSRKAHGRHY